MVIFVSRGFAVFVLLWRHLQIQSQADAANANLLVAIDDLSGLLPPLSSFFMSFISRVTCLHFSYDFSDARVQLQQVNDFGNKCFWIYRSNFWIRLFCRVSIVPLPIIPLICLQAITEVASSRNDASQVPHSAVSTLISLISLALLFSLVSQSFWRRGAKVYPS